MYSFVWFLLLSILILRFIHDIAYSNIPFLFPCGLTVFHYRDIPQFVHPFTYWLLFVLFLVIWLAMNKISMNICVQSRINTHFRCDSVNTWENSIFFSTFPDFPRFADHTTFLASFVLLPSDTIYGAGGTKHFLHFV